MDIVKWLNDKVMEIFRCTKCGWHGLIVHEWDHINDEPCGKTFQLCLYCGYLREVQGNKYIYHLLLLTENKVDLKYDVDSRGQVTIHPPQ